MASILSQCDTIENQHPTNNLLGFDLDDLRRRRVVNPLHLPGFARRREFGTVDEQVVVSIRIFFLFSFLRRTAANRGERLGD